MTEENIGQAFKLTERITEMIEGETPEVLHEINTILNYHMAYRAGQVTGKDSLEDILLIKTEELV